MRRLYQHAALPPAKQAAGRSCFHGRLSVILFRDWVEIPDPMSFLGGYPPPGIHGTWDTTGYGRHARGTHPTGMLFCIVYMLFCTIDSGGSGQSR